MNKDWFKASNEKWIIILRLTFGLTMFLHGAQKAMGWFGGYGWSNTVAFMGSKGIPAFIAHLIIIGEFIGGLALIVGFMTRVSAIGNAIIMAGAVLLVHLKAGFFAPKGFEYPFVLLMIAIYIIIKGPGRWSLDAKIFGEK